MGHGGRKKGKRAPSSSLHCCYHYRVTPATKCCDHIAAAWQVRTYQRLSPLEVAKAPLRSFNEVERGDCVVVFSRAKLYAAKAAIEAATGLGTAVVYGALPPAVRREQALRFNGSAEGVAAAAAAAAGLCGPKSSASVPWISVRRGEKGALRRGERW
jgi:hypothetical protein